MPAPNFFTVRTVYLWLTALFVAYAGDGIGSRVAHAVFLKASFWVRNTLQAAPLSIVLYLARFHRGFFARVWQRTVAGA